MLLNTPAQPDRQGLLARRAGAGLALAREHDAWVVTDEVYEHLVFDGAEHVPVATLPGMARAHPHHLLGRQDLLGDGLEGRLGARPRGGGDGGADREAVPHLRGQRSVPAGGGRGAGAGGLRVCRAGLVAAGQARPAVRGPARRWAAGDPAGRDLLRHRRRRSPGGDGRPGVLPPAARALRRRRGARVGVPRRPQAARTWCASRSASGTTCCTRPSPGSPPSPPADGRAGTPLPPCGRLPLHPREAPAPCPHVPPALSHPPQVAGRACPPPTPGRERGRHEAAAAARPRRSRPRDGGPAAVGTRREDLLARTVGRRTGPCGVRRALRRRARHTRPVVPPTSGPRPAARRARRRRHRPQRPVDVAAGAPPPRSAAGSCHRRTPGHPVTGAWTWPRPSGNQC